MRHRLFSRNNTQDSGAPYAPAFLCYPVTCVRHQILVSAAHKMHFDACACEAEELTPSFACREMHIYVRAHKMSVKDHCHDEHRCSLLPLEASPSSAPISTSYTVQAALIYKTTIQATLQLQLPGYSQAPHACMCVAYEPWHTAMINLSAGNGGAEGNRRAIACTFRVDVTSAEPHDMCACVMHDCQKLKSGTAGIGSFLPHIRRPCGQNRCNTLGARRADREDTVGFY